MEHFNKYAISEVDWQCVQIDSNISETRNSAFFVGDIRVEDLCREVCPEDESPKCLRNVSIHLQNYETSHGIGL